jgi:hypothetical protein
MMGLGRSWVVLSDYCIYYPRMYKDTLSRNALIIYHSLSGQTVTYWHMV